MTAVHSTIGTLVLLGYLATAILYFLNYTGRNMPIVRPISFAAAGLLAVQIVLGFTLLGAGESNNATHYAFAILALIPVGLEHGYAGSRPDPRQRALIGGIAAALTFVIVLLTYLLGQGTIG